MSQIILKFQEGGTPLKKDSDSKKESENNILKRGNDEIDRNEFVSFLERNFSNWLDSRSWNSKKKNEVANAYRQLVDGIYNGTITPDSVMNKSHDSTGKLKNQSDDVSKWDPYRAALNYIYDSFNKAKTIVKEKPDASKSYNLANFVKELNKILFRGSENFNKHFIDQDEIDEKTKVRGTTNRARLISDALNTMLQNINSGKLWSDSDETLKRQAISNINELLSKLSDGKIDKNELMYFSNLGIDPDLYFGQSYDLEDSESESNAPKSELELELEKALKIQEELYLNALRLYNQYNTLEDNITPLKFFDYTKWTSPWSNLKSIESKTKENALNSVYNAFVRYINNNDVFSKDRNWWSQLWNGSDFVEGHKWHVNGTMMLDPKWTNQQAFSYLLNNYIQRHKPSDDPRGFTTDGKHIIGTKNGYSYIIDPNTGNLSKIPVSKVQIMNGDTPISLMSTLPELSILQQVTSLTPSQKQGGILKAQFGNYLAVLDHNQLVKEINDRKAAQLKAKEKAKKDAEERKFEEKANGRTREEYERDNTKLSETDWSYADIARATSIGADIGSMLSAFALGAGTAVSAGLGIAGTVASVSADISEGHGWDAIKNLGIGLAFDAVGLIPGFGSSGKTAKIIKSAVKLAPKILAASTLTDPKLQASVKKLTSEKGRKEITVEDWRNIATAIKVVTGIGSSAVIAAKRSAMLAGSSKTTGDTKISLRTKSGKEIVVGDGKNGTITKAQFDDIKNAGSLKDAESILNGIKGFEKTKLAGTKMGLLPGITLKVTKSSFQEKEGTTIYNLNDVSGKRWSRFGSMDDWWSDVSLYNRHLYGGMSGVNMPSLDKLNPFTWGMKSKPSVSPTSAPTLPTVPSFMDFFKLNNKNRFFNLSKYKNPDGTLSLEGIAIASRIMPNYQNNLRKGKGLKSTLDRLNRYSTAPTNLKAMQRRNLTQDPDFLAFDGKNIIFWKQGGLINRVNNILKASGGASVPFILKGDQGLDTDWFDQYEKNYNLKVLKYNGKDISETNTPNGDNRPNMGVSGYTGYGNDRYNLKAAYLAQENYKKNKANITSDIQTYLQKLLLNNSNMTDEELEKAYNSSAEKIRSFWDYTTHDYSYKSERNRNHNRLHRDMFASRNLEKGDASTGNLGYDEANDDWIATSTWARRMDRYKDEFNGLEDRIHELDLGNGRKLKVYKKANGDIGLFSEWEKSQNPELIVDEKKNPGSTVSGDGDRGNPDYSVKPWQQALIDGIPFGMGLKRFLITDKVNRDLKNSFLKNIHPTYYDPKIKATRILGDLANKTVLYNQGAETERRVKSQYITDSSVNSALWFEANRQAHEAKTKGDLMDNLKIDQTMQEARNIEYANIDELNTIANKNKQVTENFRTMIEKYNQDYKLSQHKNLDTWLQELQATAQQKTQTWRQLTANLQDLLAQKELQEKLQNAYKAWLDYVASHQGETNFNPYNNAPYLEYKRIKDNLELDYRIKNYSNNYFAQGIPYRLNYKPFEYTY